MPDLSRSGVALLLNRDHWRLVRPEPIPAMVSTPQEPPHSDHFGNSPWTRLREGRFALQIGEPKLLPQGVAVRPILPCHSLIDDLCQNLESCNDITAKAGRGRGICISCLRSLRRFDSAGLGEYSRTFVLHP